MADVVTIENLHKAYKGQAAVDGISFAVAEGEIFGLLGPNGAGKTTTVECLQGLRRADQGRLRVLGLDPQTQRRELRGRVGSQLQESALPDRMRVWEALDLFASLTPGAPDWKVLLNRWNLEGKSKASFGSLSGGQRQRLFVALALVNEPEVVFLDEMTTGLDPAARRVAWDLVEEIRDRGKTVVLVTHFMDEAERLCDRLAILDKGKVVALGAPQSLIDLHAPAVKVRFSSSAADLDFLYRIPEVDSWQRRGERVEVDGTGAVVVRVAATLAERGILPLDLRIERATLEEVFLRLTGRAGAEDGEV
jgi:ABC-2 type transport system ATP-binding protein